MSKGADVRNSTEKYKVFVWLESEVQEGGGQRVMVVFHGMDWALHHVLIIIMMILRVLFHFIDKKSGSPQRL